VGDEASKVAADDAVPCCAFTAVELSHVNTQQQSQNNVTNLLLDELRDVLNSNSQRSRQCYFADKWLQGATLAFSMVNCSMACCAAGC
jgi:hypothetical protein